MIAQQTIQQHPAIISRRQALQQGLTRYFTGKPCVHGHTDQRLVSDGACCECRRIKLRKRYASDPLRWQAVSKERQQHITAEQKAAIARRLREKRSINPDAFRQADRRKYDRIRNDPELLEKERARQRDKQKRAYQANPERFKQRSRIRHYANRDVNNELAKQWKRDNPEKVRALNQKWNSLDRARRKQRVPKWLTAEDFATMREIYAEARRKGMHVDHVIPLQGKTVSGLHVPSNLQLLTPSENAAKRNSYEVEL